MNCIRISGIDESPSYLYQWFLRCWASLIPQVVLVNNPAEWETQRNKKLLRFHEVQKIWGQNFSWLRISNSVRTAVVTATNMIQVLSFTMFIRCWYFLFSFACYANSFFSNNYSSLQLVEMLVVVRGKLELPVLLI